MFDSVEGPVHRGGLDAQQLAEHRVEVDVLEGGEASFLVGEGLIAFLEIGADGAEGGTNVDQDVFIDFREEDVKAWAWGQVDVDTNLLVPGLSYAVQVRVFRPDGTCENFDGGTFGYPTSQIQWATAEAVPVGLRAVRAYLGGAASNRSAIRYLSLQPGTNGPVRLEIH